MGAFDDIAALMEDWTNPLLEAFFPSVMNDTESIFADQTDQNQTNVELDGASNSNALSKPTASNRGCLRERIAAKGNFNPLRLNIENLSKDPEEIQAPYLTIPPGLSPTSLLDSPVFLSNSLVLPSPTTGKLPFAPNGNNQDSALLVDDIDKGKENTFQDANASSFAYKPVAESSACPYFYAVNKVNPPSFAPKSFSSNDTNISDNLLLHQSIEPSNIYLQNNGELVHQKTYTNNPNNLYTTQNYNMFGVQEPPPLNEQEVDDGQRRSTVDPTVDGGLAEDGYNWRKYGQKPVKGSNYPRSYFKCTYLNCPVKKKVEQSVEGHITDIIYKGAHNHPKPPSNHIFPLNSPNPFEETQLEQSKNSADGDFDWSNMLENLEENTFSTLGDLSGAKYESLDQSANLSNGEDDDLVTHGSVSLGCDGKGEESDSKKRKIEPFGSDMVGTSRATREPRVVVQTMSDVDILDDGYRWRKYGQKIVKGNPNPRSYYKCTSLSCNVRKHVERASHDLKSVITTYEGKHNHPVPAARNSNRLINSGGSNHFPAQQAPSHFSNIMGRFEGSGPYNRRGRFRHGSGPGFGYGMTHQPGLTGMGMTGLGHQFTGEQAFMAPKMEPVSDSGMNASDSGLNASDASAVYNQLMSQLPPPPGPQM